MRRSWITPVLPGEFFPSLQPGHCQDYWSIAVWVPGESMVWVNCPFLELDIVREMLMEDGLSEVEIVTWGYSCPRSRLRRPVKFRRVGHGR